ncbi:DinB family protein [Streptomyces sp. NPDC003077]|uniref:DinB family protein n=1 Tax=Streptomyces sp. NPDC003077 TaxID=3154443 RepID=UPI0033BD8067
MSESTAVPSANLAPKWPGDTREALPRVGDERTILTGYLDWQRATFELKCSGLSPEQLSRRAVDPSRMSLHGLIRHLAGVERWWFRVQFAGEKLPLLYYTDDDPDQDFEKLDGDPQEALAVWREECARSREIVANAPSLDATGVHAASGEPISLRRIVVGLIGEYARHNGHADLLRERTDGVTGF